MTYYISTKSLGMISLTEIQKNYLERFNLIQHDIGNVYLMCPDIEYIDIELALKGISDEN